MTTKKLSDLPAAAPILGTETVFGLQSGFSVQIPYGSFKNITTNLVSNIANSTWSGGTDFIKLNAVSGSAYSEQSISFQEAGSDIGAKIGVKNKANGAYDIIFANRDNSSITSALTEKLRIAASGNVGIGTTDPKGKLHVIGMPSSLPATTGTTPTGLNLRLQNNDTGGVLDIGSNAGSGAWLQVTNATNLAANYPLLLNPNGGNVGIGTSSPAGKLHVSGGRSFFAASSEPFAVGAGYSAAGGAVYFGATDATATPGVQISAATGAPLLNIDSSGNVGIGYATPANKLHVSSGGNTQIRVSEVTNVFYFDMGRNSADGLFQINGNQGSGYKWLNNGTEAMRIESAGNVYLSAGQFKTNRANAAGVTTSGLVLQIDGGTHAQIVAPASGTMAMYTAGVEKMRISSAGNVGIGTFFPDSIGKLAVSNTATTDNSRIGVVATAYLSTPTYTGTFLTQGDTATTGTVCGLSNANLGSLLFQNVSAGLIYTNGNPLIFGTAGVERMRIDTSGNVGIGTISPSTYGGKLTVASDASTQSTVAIWNPGIGLAHLGFASSGSNLKLYNCYTTGTLAGGSGIDISSTGAVGIGMSPSYKLDMTVPSGDGIRVNASAGISYVILQQGGVTNGHISAAGGGGTDLSVTATRFLNLVGGSSGTILSTAGVERMRIDAAGNVTLQKNISVGAAAPTTSGVGITFPAVNVVSTSANTLDDYEEGIWTPVLTSGFTTTGTVTNRAGVFTKIGRSVTVSWIVQATTVSPANGAVMSGLPFATSHYGVGLAQSASGTGVSMSTATSGSNLVFGGTSIAPANLIGSVTYITAA